MQRYKYRWIHQDPPKKIGVKKQYNNTHFANGVKIKTGMYMGNYGWLWVLVGNFEQYSK